MTDTERFTFCGVEIDWSAPPRPEWIFVGDRIFREIARVAGLIKPAVRRTSSMRNRKRALAWRK